MLEGEVFKTWMSECPYCGNQDILDVDQETEDVEIRCESCARTYWVPVPEGE